MKYLAGVIALVGLAYGLTAYPLLDPDEGRNAEVAREMAATNDYVMPRLDGLPYPDKPVLFFAVAAAAMELLGPTVLAARLPPLVFTLATIGVVAWFARRRGGTEAAWTAAVATAASPLTLGFARTVIFDSALTFFVLAALVAFYEAMADCPGPRSPDPGPRGGRWGWAVVGWAAIAFAVLTKGPIGLALPLMIAIPYAVWRRAGRVLWAPAGPLLCAVLLLPWLMAMSDRVPGFLRYALGTETLTRLTTPDLGRNGPWWYFFPILLAGALPWSVIGVAGLVGGGWRTGGWADGRTVRDEAAGPPDHPSARLDPYVAFLLCWILVPLVFFSLSQSKRPQYVLPLVPAVGLLVAYLWRECERPAGARWGGAALIVIGLLIGATPSQLPRLMPLSSGIRDVIPGTAAWLGGVTVVCGLLALSLRRRDAVLVALAAPVATIPIAGGGLMRAIAQERSSAELAAAIARVLPPETDVVAVRAFPLSLPFYLRRPVLLATATGAELTSNYLVRDVERWRLLADSPLRAEDWWHDAAQQCRRARVFVIRADDAPTRAVLAAQVPLLIETAKYAAYGPCDHSDLVLTRPPLPPATESSTRHSMSVFTAESAETAEGLVKNPPKPVSVVSALSAVKTPLDPGPRY